MAIVEVIKYTGSPDIFAWKYPSQELGTWTQLIVNESQEAILVKGGQVCDVLGAGRHTLSTANIPILSKLINLPFGGRSPFTAEVWFINKIFSMDIKWGTSTPIQLQDPKYKLFVPVRAFGQFGIQIEESKKFLIKLVGTLPHFDKEAIVKFFRGVFLTKAKDTISSYLIHKGVSVLEINAYLDEISSFLREKMAKDFEEYGIRLLSFFVNDINVPEDDNAVIQLKNALAKRAEMDIVGYSYQQQRSFDTLEGAATNPASMQGGLMGAGIGLGMGVGMGGAFGQQFLGISQAIHVAGSKECPFCNTKISEGERYCHFCGHDVTVPSPSDGKIRCSNCGTELTQQAKFCPQCGNPYRPCPHCQADLPDGAVACPVCGKTPPTPCKGCGHPLPEGVKFCPKCGHSLLKTCSGCGKELKPDAKFCGECGTPVSGVGGMA